MESLAGSIRFGIGRARYFGRLSGIVPSLITAMSKFSYRRLYTYRQLTNGSQLTMANPGENFFSNVEKKVSTFAGEAEHFTTLVGESTLHAAIQDPIDATRQLINHVSKPLTGYELPPLTLIDAPPPAKFGSADWVAETAGSALGKTADVLLLAAGLSAIGATAAVGAAATSGFEEGSLVAGAVGTAARAALIGGTFGAVFTPSNSKDNFWKQRGEMGAVGLVSGALAGGLGYLAKEALGGVVSSIDQPIAQKVTAKVANVVVRGATSTVTGTSVSRMIIGAPVTEKSVAERALQGLVKFAVAETP